MPWPAFPHQSTTDCPTRETHVVTVWEPNAHLRTESNRPELQNALSKVRTEPYAIDWYLEHQGGVTRVRVVFIYLGLNTWGLNKQDVDAPGGRLKTTILGLFPQPTETPSSACAAEATA